MSPKYKYLAFGNLFLALAAPLSTNADVFTFDPAGKGRGIANIALIDQAPGSALAEGGITAINNFTSKSGSAGFTLHYQANLSSMQFADTSIAFSNGGGGHYFTFVAGFGQTVVAADSFPGIVSFAFDSSNPTNFFTVYATSAVGNNLTGAGFLSPAAILQAHVVSIETSNFQITGTSPVNLDRSPNGSQWKIQEVDQNGHPQTGDQQTVTGGGVTTGVTFTIDSVDSGYFPSLRSNDELTFAFFNNSQTTAFKQVDPSQCFNSIGADCGLGTGIISTGTLGAVNGDLHSGPNFMFQVDANNSFATPVPEPFGYALMLAGLGVIGLALRCPAHPAHPQLRESHWI